MNKKIFDYCIFLLSAREYSSNKLRSKLILKGFDETEIDQTITELQMKNYLNDDRYIANRTKSLINNKKKGPLYIQSKLAQEGLKISSNQINFIAEEYGIDSIEILKEAMSKIIKRKGWDPTNLDYQQKNKLAQSLQRQGFSLDQIFDLIRN